MFKGWFFGKGMELLSKILYCNGREALRNWGVEYD